MKWERVGRGWICPSFQFNGQYIIDIDDDGLFRATIQKYKGNSCQMESSQTETKIPTFEQAQTFCRNNENIERICKLSDRANQTGKASVKIPGCCPLDDETLKKHASTFGPVPASQERVESALDEEIRLGMAISRIRHIHSQIGPAFKAIGDFLNSLK